MDTELVTAASTAVPNTFQGLFIGYTVFWAMIAAYLVRLSLLVRSVKGNSSAEQQQN